MLTVSRADESPENDHLGGADDGGAVVPSGRWHVPNRIELGPGPRLGIEGPEVVHEPPGFLGVPAKHDKPRFLTVSPV